MIGFNRFNAKPVYIIPGAKRPFHSKKDMEYYCQDNGIDVKSVQRYDSNKEYERYKELCSLEKAGKIRDLKRQVQFEIIPEHSHEECTGFKDIPIYIITGEVFGKKKDALSRAKELGVKCSSVEKSIKTVAEYKHIIDELKSVYTADFTYFNEKGDYVVEDTKSSITRKQPDYVLRRKLMLDRLGIIVKET